MQQRPGVMEFKWRWQDNWQDKVTTGEFVISLSGDQELAKGMWADH